MLYSSDTLKVVMARLHFFPFVEYMWSYNNYEVNWHHKVLCEYLEKWAFGNIKRLMVFMPPGSGKSELVSRNLPAWIFGKNPDAMMMATSYGASLASDMNRDVQRILDSEAYKKVFPTVGLSGKSVRTVTTGSSYLRNTEVFEIVNHKGYYKCAGIGGSITGKRFFYGIIDDPLRGRKDAESQTTRDTIWNWYKDDFHTRQLNKDARILLTLTRWHADDLAGRLLEEQRTIPNGDKWTVVRIPMISEEDDRCPEDPREVGQPLWPSRFGGIEAMEALRQSKGTYSWAGLYQQRPTLAAGNIFNRGWWRYYKQSPEEQAAGCTELIQTWDCTFKDGDGTDYVVGQVWGRDRADKYLIDQVRGRMDFPTTLSAIRSLSAKWPKATRKLIEDKANGPAVISTLQHEIAGIIPVKPEGGKVVRAQAAAPTIESGNVYLPSPVHAPWIHDFVQECSDFPNGKHDDMVDACTYSLNYFINRPQKQRVALPHKLISSGDGWR